MLDWIYFSFSKMWMPVGWMLKTITPRKANDRWICLVASNSDQSCCGIGRPKSTPKWFSYFIFKISYGHLVVVGLCWIFKQRINPQTPKSWYLSTCNAWEFLLLAVSSLTYIFLFIWFHFLVLTLLSNHGWVSKCLALEKSPFALIVLNCNVIYHLNCFF